MPTEPYTGEQDDDPLDDRKSAPSDELAALRDERDEFQDRWRRSVAEFDNYRRRTERERRDFAEAAAADLLRDLLPVVDDFERALAIGAPEDAASGDAYHRGVELIYRQLLETLKRHGAEPFASVGELFDPAQHEAVAQGPADGYRDGEITDEFRRGYRLRSRLLRPAQVKVAKA
jgi:molecular chaperone GrpE